MTVGLLSLGDIEDLLDGSFSGFAHPGSKEILLLLENDTGSVYNAVVQQGSLGYRQATLAFIARDTTEKNAARGYDETGETVQFVDFDGSESTVMVYGFTSSLKFGDVWDVTVTLLELSEPEPPGS